MSNLIVSFSSDSGLNLGSFEKVKGAYITDSYSMPLVKSSPVPPGYTAGYQASAGLSGELSFSLQDANSKASDALQEAAVKGKNFNTLHVFEVVSWNGGKDKKAYYIPKRQLTLYNVTVQIEQGNLGEVFSVSAVGQFAEQKFFKQDDDKPSFKALEPEYLDNVNNKLLDKLDTSKCKAKEAEELKSGSN